MKLSGWIPWVGVLLATLPAFSQSTPAVPDHSISTMRVTTRAVLVDVVVTDANGNPVRGLGEDDFAVWEDGKSQTVSYFDEQRQSLNATPVLPVELPPDVFCNFSPMRTPPAVNVLLLDSLNTTMEDQTYVHQQALRFLASVHPGTRMAIFTMSLGLHFVQGFTDDPTLLLAGLKDSKNNEIEVPALMKSPEETNARTAIISIMSRPVPAGPGATTTAAPQAMIDALVQFFQDTSAAEETDRAYRTLENLQRLARFLGVFPGRKNLIWFSESFPLRLFGDSSQRMQDQIRKTVNLLTAARVAVYPVDARGVKEYHFYEAANTTRTLVNSAKEVMGAASLQAQSILGEKEDRDSDQETMRMLAEDSGGKAFVNTNGLADVIADIAANSSDFYTLSYSPTNTRMDGKIRRIKIKVAGGKYHLSYRRAYYASDAGLPGAVDRAASRDRHPGSEKEQAETDPLAPYMEFGMPESEQILFKLLMRPEQNAFSETARQRPDKQSGIDYSMDFAIDLKDLHLHTTPDGMHQGTLYVEFLVYDRYGGPVRREEHRVALRVTPQDYANFEKYGVQMHAVLQVPKGQYWLRTGVYDAETQRVGTMEIPLDAVKAIEVAAR
ncbi:MAG TPA: VWA domain-containing protein [Terracidiphilus sp.]|nr:VWA domain-containing protein [Terracidiphilus sp.]